MKAKITKLSNGKKYINATIKEIITAMENYDRYQKAFALACRDVGYITNTPFQIVQEGFLECAESEQICRKCGCTNHDGCREGCYWVEEDLCSRCVEKEEK